MILARNARELKTAIAEIKEVADIEPYSAICDVSRYAAVQRVVGSIFKRFGRIDVLINCAATQAPIGQFVSNDMKVWEQTLSVNLMGSVYMCRSVLPHMVRHRSGVIINFGGGGATSSRPNFWAYASSKTAILRFTEVLAEEVKKYGVRVNAIAPGVVKTSMLMDILKHKHQAGKSEIMLVKKRIKDGGTPPEVAAELAVYLASSSARELTGRLISAPWDDWRHWDRRKIKEIMKSDQFTLRRVV